MAPAFPNLRSSGLFNLRRFNRPVGSDRLYFGFTITKAFQIAESDEAQRVTRRADFLEYLEPTLQLRTNIVTERAIGCEFHLFRAEMEFMLNARGWRITDVVHRAQYKGVEHHARKQDADEGNNHANHFSISPSGSHTHCRDFRPSAPPA